MFGSHCCYSLAEGCQGQIQDFFRGGGALISCSTSTPIDHIVFSFWQNTSCIRKLQVISGGGGGVHPLHPPPRRAPGCGMLVASSCINLMVSLLISLRGRGGLVQFMVLLLEVLVTLSCIHLMGKCMSHSQG